MDPRTRYSEGNCTIHLPSWLLSLSGSPCAIFATAMSKIVLCFFLTVKSGESGNYLLLSRSHYHNYLSCKSATPIIDRTLMWVTSVDYCSNWSELWRVHGW